MNKLILSTCLFSAIILAPITSYSFDQSSPADSLVVDGNGLVGIGTNSPNKALNIVRQDGKATIRIEEQASNTQKRFLIQLDNNGPTGARFTNTAAGGNTWQFAQTNNGGFTIAGSSTTGQDIKIEPDGAVSMGPTSTRNFNLLSNGDLTIAGDITANGVALSSSRTLKTDIVPIESNTILDKLKKMKISEWRYKRSQEHDRHISPMAEDFHALFKLGPDNKHINPNDLASVAIVAAQHLNKQTEILLKENSSLKKRLSTLESLIKTPK